MTARWCQLNNVPEVKDLHRGLDFRLPQYRREVFLRFYEFHLKHRAHPGAVYYALPWLANYYNLDLEDKLWMAFINGCSQHIVTTSIIFERFPKFKDIKIEELTNWWQDNHMNFKAGSGWDSDRKYFKIGKTGFSNCVEKYKTLVDKFGSQVNMFESLNNTGDVYKNFENTWGYVRSNFLTFGRLSTFSYLEYLRIQGLPIDCNSLFLDDIDGSKSHRNGLCKVLGRDDLDWWETKASGNDKFEGYNKETIDWLTEEGDQLFNEAKERIVHNDVSYFTLESTLCCYKSWHRPDRRYPNVYNDMFYNRIKYSESVWGNKFDHFWKMREDCLPKNLRLESNLADPGYGKRKQNHYRLTGQVIMMDQDWDCFANNFNDGIELLGE